MHRALPESTLDRLFYGLGYALGEIEAGAAPGKAGAAGSEPTPHGPRPVPPSTDVPPQMALASAAATAAAGWLVTRLLRPRPVSWPRVLLAGLVGTALHDLVSRAEEDDVGPAAPYDAEALLADASRYAGGVATAAFYAAVVHPRLPGPPLLRGLLFGALDAAAADAGGAAGLLLRYIPDGSVPLQMLVVPAEAAEPAAKLAYGLGLGLAYRG